VMRSGSGLRAPGALPKQLSGGSSSACDSGLRDESAVLFCRRTLREIWTPRRQAHHTSCSILNRSREHPVLVTHTARLAAAALILELDADMK